MTGMESPLELPIFVDYQPSVRIGIVNTLVHLGAIFCLFLAELPLTVRGLISACVLVNYGCHLKQFLAAESICFKLDRRDQWKLLRDGHEAVDLILLPGTLVHPKIVALCFKEPTGRIHYCVLTQDNLDKQTLRRLRVRLRWPR